jgi:hypothetical protein
MNMKSWYLSKTLWLNAIAVLAMLLQTKFGFVIDPESQAGILAVVNLILRVITHQPLEWKAGSVDEADSEPPHFIPPGTAGFIRLSLVLACLLICASLLFMGCAGTAVSTATSTASATDTVVSAKDNTMALAGKSLLAVKSTIVTSAGAVDALCKAGKIGPDKCTQAKEAYDLAKPAYDAAVDSYLLMSQGYGDTASFGVALARVQSLATNLSNIAGGAN